MSPNVEPSVLNAPSTATKGKRKMSESESHKLQTTRRMTRLQVVVDALL